jgi:RNA polymerase sigma factor (TIGR02999 family)
MRRILVDHARSRGFQKRGGAIRHIEIEEGLAVPPSVDLDLLALDRALEKLKTIDERKAQVVELRFFGGLTVDETAEALGISSDTVKRDWALAKLWLRRELGGETLE